jgi:glycopeptide antibiotics resistance protein
VAVSQRLRAFFFMKGATMSAMFSIFEFFPIPFLMGLLILIIIIVRLRSRGWVYLLVLALFGLYIMAVIDVVFFPIPLPRSWPANLTWKETLNLLSQVNLIPFNYGSLFMYPSSLFTALRDITLNIVLTIPFGWGICYLTKPHVKRIIWLSLAIGLFLEGTQLMMKLTLGLFFHAVDISDVIWNGLGVIAGYGLYHAGLKIFKQAKLGV